MVVSLRNSDFVSPCLFPFKLNIDVEGYLKVTKITWQNRTRTGWCIKAVRFGNDVTRNWSNFFDERLPNAVLLNRGLVWNTRLDITPFGNNPALTGQTSRWNFVDLCIAGVTKRHFTGLGYQKHVQSWKVSRLSQSALIVLYVRQFCYYRKLRRGLLKTRRFDVLSPRKGKVWISVNSVHTVFD